MGPILFLAAGIGAWWLGLPGSLFLSAVLFLAAFFLLYQKKDSFMLEQLLMASGIAALGFFQQSIASAIAIAAGLFLLFLFSRETQHSLPRVLRVRFLAMYAFFAWASALLAFIELFGITIISSFIAGFLFSSAAFIAATSIVRADDAVFARAQDPAILRIFALALALAALEAFLFVVWMPFAWGPAAVLLAALLWGFVEAASALRSQPMALGRIVRAAAISLGVVVITIVSAPWPEGFL